MKEMALRQALKGSKFGVPPTSLAMATCGFVGDRSYLRLLTGRPCKLPEERSCNLVNAECAQVLKRKFPAMADMLSASMGKKCNTGDLDFGINRSTLGATDNCNARLVDLPYKMRNPIADLQDSGYTKLKRNWAVNKIVQGLGFSSLPVDATPAQTVWGQAVHGKTGSWAMDSGTEYIYDHLYRIPQYNPGFPPKFLEKAIPDKILKLRTNKRGERCGEFGDIQ